MEAFKKAGGLAFKKKDFKEAVKMFTKAIELDSKNTSLYGNRSVAYLKCKDYSKAIEDAETCIKLQPDWAKGYVRKGNALLEQSSLDEAHKAYSDGLSKNPDASTKKQLEAGLRVVESRKEPAMGNPMANMQNMFAKIFDGMWAKLAMNPETKAYIDEPETREKLQRLQNSPNPFSDPSLLKDPKISKCLNVLLGGGMNFGGPEGAPEDGSAPSSSSAEVPSEQPKPAAKPEPEPEPELTENEKKSQEIKKQADEEKKKGNEFYKKRKYEEALGCYEKALEIDPTNCTYLSNKASVYMTMKDFDQALKICEEAFKLADAHNADYKEKAKILTKTGKCYSKKGDHAKACDYYQKSLMEDYSALADRLLRQTKEYMEKVKKKNYIDPEKSQEHMAKGRQLFGEKKWRGAIEEFSEALKRDPKNYKAYSNRAFTYSKIMDWNNAVSDCEVCMAMAPDFVKIYIRKAKIEMFLKRYHKALKAVNTGLKKNPGEKELKELSDLKRQVMYAVQMGNSGEVDKKRIEEAQKDPEIRAITSDPIIQKVLSQMKDDPSATQRALADPGIAEKLEMLMAAGILRTG
mmetsp:Transcript_20591/g.33430  ORF Transcript_20591/g.33430 Transcript_20591/m.33430 type:complete len:576 (-) Transcript_20591:192-1919(-)